MKFDELDKKMRVYEMASDYCVPPEFFLIARIDGRNFTRLTKELCNFEAPFDETFRNYMVETTKHLMTCGFNIQYGFTESDEISLLFDINDTSFGRKTRKLISILAGEASAKFTSLLGQTACFDCRLSILPNQELVIDYFRWRNEDANRNSLNSHCYWLERKKGLSQKEATSLFSGKTVAFKNEHLFKNNINYNDLPNWQKRGIGLYWEEYQKPILGAASKIDTCIRKRIIVNYDLPMKEEYSDFIKNQIAVNLIKSEA